MTIKKPRRGRPPSLNDEQIREVMQYVKDWYSVNTNAMYFNVSPTAINTAIKRSQRDEEKKWEILSKTAQVWLVANTASIALTFFLLSAASACMQTNMAIVHNTSFIVMSVSMTSVVVCDAKSAWLHITVKTGCILAGNQIGWGCLYDACLGRLRILRHC